MNQLVCWTVSGLRRSGPHEVWVMLGTYSSQDAAKSAADNGPWASAGICETRVMPYYRSPMPGQPIASPHVTPAVSPPSVSPIDHPTTVA